MSGIITGPYFNSYFNQPTHFQLGNMVAILEIGALGKFDVLKYRFASIKLMRDQLHPSQQGE